MTIKNLLSKLKIHLFTTHYSITQYSKTPKLQNSILHPSLRLFHQAKINPRRSYLVACTVFIPLSALHPSIFLFRHTFCNPLTFSTLLLLVPQKSKELIPPAISKKTFHSNHPHHSIYAGNKNNPKLYLHNK